MLGAIALKDYFLFNHHSLPYSSRAQVNEAMPEFLKLCLGLNRLGLQTFLVDQDQDTHWFQLELAPRYYWRDWYNESLSQGTLKDQIRAFRSISTKQPFFNLENDNINLAQYEVYELATNSSYEVLKAAVLYNSPIVSFPTRNPWNQSPLQVVVHILDVNGYYEENSRNIINLYNCKILSENESKLHTPTNKSSRISEFFGITVQMFVNDNERHHLPHIHVNYQSYRASISLDDNKILGGNLPDSQYRNVKTWMDINRKNLIEAWRLACKGIQPNKLSPLE